MKSAKTLCCNLRNTLEKISDIITKLCRKNHPEKLHKYSNLIHKHFYCVSHISSNVVKFAGICFSNCANIPGRVIIFDRGVAVSDHDNTTYEEGYELAVSCSKKQLLNAIVNSIVCIRGEV